jgi:hypothetical protein
VSLGQAAKCAALVFNNASSAAAASVASSVVVVFVVVYNEFLVEQNAGALVAWFVNPYSSGFE